MNRDLTIKPIRLTGNPIIKEGMEGLEGEKGANINGASLIRVPNWVDRPLGKYYLYFAHHHGQYIRLAYANSIEGPWTIYKSGSLHLDQTFCEGHIASPDVHIVQSEKKIYMYFHGPVSSEKLITYYAGRLGLSKPNFPLFKIIVKIYRKYRKEGQKTFLAVSNDGIEFQTKSAILGPFYFRVFNYKGYHYALAKKDNQGNIIMRSKNGHSYFKEGSLILPGTRHTAVYVENNTLNIYYTRVGDCPESILLSQVDLSYNWRKWTPSTAKLILKPEMDYEGANEELLPSSHGTVYGMANQLRDPAIFKEDDSLFLLYSVAGEKGIAIARLVEAV